MRKLTRFVQLSLLLAMVLAVGSFVLENQQVIVLSFLGWTTPEAPASVFVVVALIVGLVIGPSIAGLLLAKRQTSPRH
ncbi:lipopolysaccharide assembly protein LapA domain-containing protein [Pseudomonas lurida]|uniref:lipopolysaccharide assembly protein LapA domain-containing protein n=1 Tax=Pseudomonas lurida TaxID=244566 RepID=UPI000F06DC9B|nr:lipopolysaccharide assembly protein LapA domain-containing protein [Pseudomonas lurida]MBD8670988.1 DUF1049 domain-containing protein [Pseudomonas lurida]UZQ75839.1 lipopolysaccharide assembly protein LapA domain-containing protein [Pseudomonas lurida]